MNKYIGDNVTPSYVYYDENLVAKVGRAAMNARYPGNRLIYGKQDNLIIDILSCRFETTYRTTN